VSNRLIAPGPTPTSVSIGVDRRPILKPPMNTDFGRPPFRKLQSDSMANPFHPASKSERRK
jgi:hypothetical protein